MENKFEAFLTKANANTLSKKELNLVVNELHNDATKVDRFVLLEILGRSGTDEYKNLVETYLDSPDDPMLASLALRILCFYWNLTSDYTNRLMEFMNDVSWDTNRDCKLTAINISGEYLRKHSSKNMLSKLLSIFNAKKENELIRQAAYLALARAIGKDYKEIPSAASSFDLEDEIDPEVLSMVEKRLQKS